MMRKSEIYKSNFLKADQLASGAGKYTTMTVTIDGITTHEFDDGKSQRVLSFKETDQQLGLNLTNWDSVAEITGKDDDDEWIGHQIELYVDKNVTFQGKRVPAIRIRAVGDGPSAPATPPPPVRNGPPPPPGKRPPSAMPNTTATTMEGAWKCYIDSSGNGDEAAWMTSIARVEKESGKSQDDFGPAEWGQMAALSVPF